MKVRYDPKADTLTLVLRSMPLHESGEDKPGVILDASKRVENPHRID